MSEADCTEVWRAVEGFDYWVSTHGRVMNAVTGKILKPTSIGRQAYLVKVMLTRDHKSFNKPIHRLVLDTFVGPCPEGMECRHLDGNGKNNRLENLAWGTKAENTADKFRHGTMTQGARHPMVKLTEDEVREIRRLRRDGWSQKNLAEKFNISLGHVSGIYNGKYWANLKEGV